LQIHMLNHIYHVLITFQMHLKVILNLIIISQIYQIVWIQHII